MELCLEAEELLARILIQKEEASKAQDGLAGMLVCQHYASASSKPIPKCLLKAFEADVASSRSGRRHKIHVPRNRPHGKRRSLGEAPKPE